MFGLKLLATATHGQRRRRTIRPAAIAGGEADFRKLYGRATRRLMNSFKTEKAK
jgi:hypothetical protein